ncbi:MAG: hypothetical protein PHG23_01470 [Candidatus Pacebacteria bacterium]|nr:hypothetical protein [Candidatus Paceibacterota bacterium]
MNKSIFTNILIAIGLLFVAPAALAATLNFSPTTVNTTAGEDFSLQINLNSQDAPSYTAKVELSYPADLLSINSFTPNGDWMQLKQSGYDLIDNANGVLIKSGGYPSGFSSTVNFGTVSFHAKAAGSATITVGSNSFVYNAAGTNVLSSNPVESVNIAEAASTVVNLETTPAAETGTENAAPAETTAPEANNTVTENTAAAANAAASAQGSLASIAGRIVTLNTNNFWVGFLVIVIIIGIIYYAFDMISKRSKKQ